MFTFVCFSLYLGLISLKPEYNNKQIKVWSAAGEKNEYLTGDFFVVCSLLFASRGGGVAFVRFCNGNNNTCLWIQESWKKPRCIRCVLEIVTFCLHLDHFTVNAYTKGVSPLEISRRLIGLAVARSESQISRRLAENWIETLARTVLTLPVSQEQ